MVGGDGPQTTTLRVRAAAGDWRWVELAAVDARDDALAGIVCAVRDITAEVEDPESLQASEEMFRGIAGSSEDGIWAVSPQQEPSTRTDAWQRSSASRRSTAATST